MSSGKWCPSCLVLSVLMNKYNCQYCMNSECSSPLSHYQCCGWDQIHGSPTGPPMVEKLVAWIISWLPSLFWLIFEWFLYPRPTKLEGGYTGFTLSVCLSVRPSVCRRHGFRSISPVCFGISISNFICMLMVAIGRSLLIFSDVTFKMAAWRPYWIFWFPDS